jgi:hypothetical protein
VLATDCLITPAAQLVSTAANPPKFKGIWDTGATSSVITQKVVDACGLKPTGMVNVHGVHGAKAAETYLVNIGFPSKVEFSNLTVTKGELSGADALIGMDIICQGDLSITNRGGLTVFCFRFPSIGATDFIEDDRKRAESHARQQHGGKSTHTQKHPKSFGKKKGR